jgi:hypothetical protein
MTAAITTGATIVLPVSTAHIAMTVTFALTPWIVVNAIIQTLYRTVLTVKTVSGVLIVMAVLSVLGVVV